MSAVCVAKRLTCTMKPSPPGSKAYGTMEIAGSPLCSVASDAIGWLSRSDLSARAWADCMMRRLGLGSRCLTFDISGGQQTAKPAVGRALDGRVRRHSCHGEPRQQGAPGSA